MRYLLDTHVFLWAVGEPERIPHKALSVLKDPDSQLFFSAASGWEIAIKHGLGKLALPDAPEVCIPKFMQIHGMVELPVTLGYTLRVGRLPNHHKDPFDRIIIAQALFERMTIITYDKQIGRYGARTL